MVDKAITAGTGISVTAATGVIAVSGTLADIAGLTPTDNTFIVGDGTDYVSETAAQARVSMGVEIGVDVQAWDANLDQLAALTPSDGYFVVGDGTAWNSLSPANARDAIGLDTDNDVAFNSVTTDTINEQTASAGVTIDGVLLRDSEMAYNYLGNPTGSKTLTVGPYDVQWNFTAAGGTWNYAWTGNASGHLFELLQQTGNVSAGTHLLHVEANDVDATCGHFQHNSASGTALLVNSGIADFRNAAIVYCNSVGIDYSSGSDSDIDITTVDVTGTPVVKWDESEDAFSQNKGMLYTAGDVYASATTQDLGKAYNPWGNIYTQAISMFGGDVKTINGAVTAEVGHLNYITDSGTPADYTVTLPDATTNSGKCLALLVDTSATKKFTVDGNSTQTIDGSDSIPMGAKDFLLIYSNGSNWVILIRELNVWSFRTSNSGQEVTADTEPIDWEDDQETSVHLSYSSGTWTVAEGAGGRYAFMANVELTGSGSVQYKLYVNGSHVLTGPFAETSNVMPFFNGTYRLADGDTFSFRLSATRTLNTTTERNHVHVWRIGD